MTISLGNAFKSVTEDAQWKKKIAIGGGLYFVLFLLGMISGMCQNCAAVQLAVFILSLITGVYMLGYIFSTVNKQLNSDSNALAEWCEQNLMVKGLKSLWAQIVYFILVTILLMIVSFVITLGIGLIFALIYFVLMTAMGNGATIIFNVLTGLASFVLLIVFYLYCLQFFSVAFALFFKTYKISNILAFKKHFRIIKENTHTTWTLVGKQILFSLAYMVILLALCVTIVGSVLIPFVYFAGTVVAMNLIVQYARKINLDRYID